jgi:hypothetical protein
MAVGPAKAAVEPVEPTMPIVVAADLVVELIMAVNLVVETTVGVDLAVEPALSSNLVIEPAMATKLTIQPASRVSVRGREGEGDRGLREERKEDDGLASVLWTSSAYEPFHHCHTTNETCHCCVHGMPPPPHPLFGPSDSGCIDGGAVMGRQRRRRGPRWTGSHAHHLPFHFFR